METIDMNMIPLYSALNSMKGIETVSVCGGFGVGNHSGPCVFGKWYVTFTVNIEWGGMVSLANVIHCINCLTTNKIRITVCLEGDYPKPESIYYKIEGWDDEMHPPSVGPNNLARMIEADE